MKGLIEAVHPVDAWTRSTSEVLLLADSEDTLCLSRDCELLVRDWRALRSVRSFKPDGWSPAGLLDAPSLGENTWAGRHSY